MTDIETRGMQAGRIPLWFETRARLGLLRSAITGRGEPIPIDQRRQGLDLSHWNGLMNHQTAVNAGIKFAYFRATLGTTYFDDQYNNNIINAGVCYPWGSYHALSSIGAGGTQALWFYNHIKDKPGEIRPMLDVEVIVSAAVVKSCVLQMYSDFTVYPILYTSAYRWSLLTGEIADKLWISNHCELHVAHWNTNSPLIPAGWATYAIHQYSADGNRLGTTYGAPPPPAADSDIDLNYTRQSWLDQYAPQPSLEARVTAIEDCLVRNGLY